MSVSRRRFLQGAALLAATALLPPAQRLLAAAAIQPQGDHLADYLAALETPYAAPLNDHFERVIQSRHVDLLLYDLNSARLVTALAPERPLPVASAFKGPVLIYFVDTVDPAVWSRVPAEYWIATRAEDVPEEFRADWRQHQGILQALYRMVAISDNPATGQVLSYMARAQGRDDPLVMFNDWARERVGVSQLSALSAWNDGVAGDMSPVDRRYLGRGTALAGQVMTFENMMTPRDLGLFYLWMLDHLPPDGLRACREMLSIIHDNRPANLRRLTLDVGGTAYSRNGSLITDAGTIITDAGLMDLNDGRRFLLVVLTLDAPQLVPGLFEELNHTLRGRYNEIIHNHRYNAVSAEELRETYLAHLRAAYPQQDDNSGGRFRYGFIIPEGVQVYSAPDETRPLRNPIIRSTRFGVHLLMQGALVRFVEVDGDWLELMPDNDRDNVRARLGVRLFVKRADVWPIAPEYSRPIPRLSDQDIGADDKFVAIHLVARELVAFEGAQPVLRVPIVLNPEDTPRGVYIITSKWLARSMQPWAPGVPFTSFFGNQGYALHGSPWQRWMTTVNQGNITGRSSAGCVNLPDWMVRAGDYHRPADELLFRWIGGMENVHERVFDYPSPNYPALRIFSVDYAHNLRTYHRPDGLVRAGASWDAALEASAALPLQAPDSFFV
jgi:hypothetical protein